MEAPTCQYDLHNWYYSRGVTSPDEYGVSVFIHLYPFVPFWSFLDPTFGSAKFSKNFLEEPGLHRIPATPWVLAGSAVESTVSSRGSTEFEHHLSWSICWRFYIRWRMWKIGTFTSEKWRSVAGKIIQCNYINSMIFKASHAWLREGAYSWVGGCQTQGLGKAKDWLQFLRGLSSCNLDASSCSMLFLPFPKKTVYCGRWFSFSSLQLFRLLWEPWSLWNPLKSFELPHGRIPASGYVVRTYLIDVQKSVRVMRQDDVIMTPCRMISDWDDLIMFSVWPFSMNWCNPSDTLSKLTGFR